MTYILLVKYNQVYNAIVLLVCVYILCVNIHIVYIDGKVCVWIYSQLLYVLYKQISTLCVQWH